MKDPDERGAEKTFFPRDFFNTSLSLGPSPPATPPFTSARCWAARRGSSQKGRRKRGEKSGPGRKNGGGKRKEEEEETKEIVFLPLFGSVLFSFREGKKKPRPRKTGGEKWAIPPLFLGWPWLARATTREKRGWIAKKRGEPGRRKGGGGGEDFLAPFFLFPFRFCLPSGKGSLSFSLEGRRREIRGGLEIDKKGKKKKGKFRTGSGGKAAPDAEERRDFLKQWRKGVSAECIQKKKPDECFPRSGEKTLPTPTPDPFQNSQEDSLEPSR